MALAPIALITILYSLPVFGNRKTMFRIREIPYLKIFIIAFVWSFLTIILPVSRSSQTFSKTLLVLMLLERFFFVFAITIPFDVRDMKEDKRAGIKTIPTLLNEKTSYILSCLALLIFVIISFIHYQTWSARSFILPVGISAITTFVFLTVKRIRNLPYYYYGILDGTMLLQGLLFLIFSSLKICIL